MKTYLILAAVWTGWCVLHSGMITPAVTGRIEHRFGSFYRFYRLAYNVVSLVTLVPVLLYAKTVAGPILFRFSGMYQILRFTVLFLSLSLFYAGARRFDGLQFLGLRQALRQNSSGALSDSGTISRKGILSVIRHPWYLAAILLIWSSKGSITVPVLIANIILTIYIIAGTYLEERKLIAEFGQSYRDYQASVSMFFPFKWLKSAFLPA